MEEEGGSVATRGELGVRLLGAALALIAGGIHLALAFADLIPGESTQGALFAAMGLGFVGCAAALFARRRPIDILVAAYAGALILGYASSRGDYPVEVIGLASKAAEAGLAVVALVLARGDKD